MAITKEYYMTQAIIGTASNNSAQPFGENVAKMVHGVNIYTDSETGLSDEAIAQPYETDWDTGSFGNSFGIIDLLSDFEVAKIIQALGVDRNGRAARLVNVLQMTNPVLISEPIVIPDAQLLALSALLDAEKTRRGI